MRRAAYAALAACLAGAAFAQTPEDKCEGLRRHALAMKPAAAVTPIAANAFVARFDELATIETRCADEGRHLK
jgi:hypothetical protein